MSFHMLRVKLMFVFSFIVVATVYASARANNVDSIFNLHDSSLEFPTTSYPSSSCKEVDWVPGKQGSLTKIIDNPPFKRCWTITSDKVEFIKIHVVALLLPANDIYRDEKCISSGNYLSLDPSPNLLSGQYVDSEYYQHDLSDYFSDDSLFLCGETPERTSYTFQARVLKLVFSIQENYLSSLTGFSLFYEIVETCDASVKIDTYDFVLSPGFPKYPSPGTVCTWNISLFPPSTHLPIQFSLSTWDVGLSNTSSLTFYDGTSRKDRVLAKYFASTPFNVYKSVVTSTGENIFLEFKFGSSHQLYQGEHGFNATFKVQGYCLPGSRPCGDGKNCFVDNQACDRHRDCENGNDELGCLNKGCTSNEFWCGSDLGDCYSRNQRCDGVKKCLKSNVDERECESCSGDSYYCKTSKTCIIAKYKCDGERDCSGSEDEEGCSYVTSRRVITAAIVGSLICGWLLAIALGCSCKLYSLRNSSPGYRHGRYSLSTPLGQVARTLLQREAPPSYNMTVDGVDTNEHSRSRSASRRERRRRRRNREPHIRRAQPAPRESEAPISNDANNRVDTQIAQETIPTSRQSRSMTTELSAITEESGRNCTEQPQPNTNDADDVPFILAEMGLAEHPTRTSTIESTSTSPSVPEMTPSTSTESNEASRPSGSNVSADDEPQAQPLPIKKRIRPVMVEAPFNAVLADEIPACVYPNPPSYSEALLTGEPQTTPVVSFQTQESELPSPKSPKRPKELLTKLWPKSNHKTRKFWMFSSITDVFTSNSPARPLRHSDNNSLDEDQLQLIDEFANEDSQSLIEYRSPVSVADEEFVPPSDTNCFNLMPVQRSPAVRNLNSSQSAFSQNSSTVAPTGSSQTTSQSLAEPQVINAESNDPVDGTVTTSMNSSLTLPEPVWSSPVRVTIPEIRLETTDRLLTLNISGSLSERT